ncbi:hypothetical protein DICVIV_03183 [Dictyocaulus viviparus]|uniref:RING-CH-type domain-containing protein n=1 Tax=Dictyocaulus viviparus TaxID=29172 RepID=A0A0D8Y1C4_DICVI|nr:hypothetical protein DICVIV_03183 [Dictyocaulus viviparus]
MGLVASCVLSVTGCERVCKFCYGDDDQDSRWLRPCMCSGSLKSWVLKPFSEWCRPAIKLSAWECIEIFLDTYSTYKFLRGFVLIIDGERSIVMQTLHFIFWRIFIATDRRLAYYASLIRLIMSSIFIISVKDCIPESEK